jgi:ribosomal protein S12 methylthiotransferase
LFLEFMKTTTATRPGPAKKSAARSGRAPARPRAAAAAKLPTVGFVSLGCPKALVDSERIVTQLRAEGYALSPTYDGADLVIVNTCGFIDSAVQESLDAIGEALDANGKVIVTGCLGAKSEGGENLVAKVHPKVLAVTGPHAMEEVMSHVHEHLPKPHDPFTDLVPPAGVKLTPRHYAYLKISEGCNHRCSFCVIPSMRGDLVSRPIGEVVREAQNLLKQGVRELLVVSQDTSAYGVDLKYKLDFVGGRAVKTRMTELVRELGALAADHGAWVRLHYVYPYPHVDEIIPLMAQMAQAGGVLPYLDVPFQHAHPEVLKRMKRPASGEKNIERVRAWRQICPQITLRSTFIAGFPGETEAQFDYLLDFLREAQLDRVGCFAYSPVEGAAANALDGAVPEPVREARRARFMEIQASISRDRLRAKVGSVQRVLIDEVAPKGGSAVGRSAADAPEIDGVVHVKRPARSKVDLRVGEFVDVRIDSSDEHDLAGTLL